MTKWIPKTLGVHITIQQVHNKRMQIRTNTSSGGWGNSVVDFSLPRRQYCWARRCLVYQSGVEALKSPVAFQKQIRSAHHHLCHSIRILANGTRQEITPLRVTRGLQLCAHTLSSSQIHA